LTGVAGTVILRRWKSTLAVEMPNASLDIGQPVRVIKWNDNGSARVFYRGAEWDAETESSDTPHDASLYIVAVRGSALVLTHNKPQQQ
jgi:membrane protein implicated in regulation of membrane protease activity